MSNDRKISRRASLRGIAATGAFISGTGLSAGTVSASEKKGDYIKTVEFHECHSMAIHLKKGVDKLPITIRAYNADRERVENIQQIIKKKTLLPYELWKEIHDGKNKQHDYDNKKKAACLCGDHDKKDDHDKKKDDRKYVWTFSIYQFYHHAIDAGDKILSVKIGDKRIKNTNDCAKKYTNEYDKKGKVDTNDIYLKPICVNSEYNTVRYCVDNWNKKPVTVTCDGYNTTHGGKVYVEPHSATYFDVKADGSNSTTKVGLYYNGTQIDTVEPDGHLRECLAKDQIAFSVNDLDYADHKVEFYLHDGTDFDRTFHYYDSETGAAGTVTVHDDPGSAETFWLPAPYCKTSIKLFYQGHVVGKVKTGSDLSGPVVNKTQKKSYQTIQNAVDDANEGDTIIVCEDQQLDDFVDVFVEDLTIKGFEKPVVDGSGNSRVFGINADGVTIKKLKITNPEELIGILIGEGVDGVTIRDNRIFDIGPTENLVVTGIRVTIGDHDNITIKNNTIEDLEQTGEGTSVNGILFLVESFMNPGTLADVTVEHNTFRELDSTRAPLGIVVQHNVDNLLIKNTKITDLTADNDFGPGSEITFAQGISIDSRSTNEFDIVGNTIKNVVSNDGFFGEDIKIEPEADKSGIAINENNLLSAIGVNNADGQNLSVDAENNFWGDEDGPIVIEGNDDDGTVTTADGEAVDLDDFEESAVTENVEFVPFAESKK